MSHKLGLVYLFFFFFTFVAMLLSSLWQQRIQTSASMCKRMKVCKLKKKLWRSHLRDSWKGHYHGRICTVKLATWKKEQPSDSNQMLTSLRPS